MGYKILAADDSNVCLKIIHEIFNLVGDNYDLIYAHNGREAVDKAIECLPDLILMDIIMPEMNGVKAIQALRKNELTKDIPVIVLSATESLQSAFEAGANDFITKPFKHYELLIRAKQALLLVEKLNKIKKQRDQIAEQKQDIIDDINYSKRIQSAILPTKDYITSLMPEHFIFNRPKNIVSGDFYWVGQKEDKIILAVADCTGHGISGSFMTMAGTAFLNEIINAKTQVNSPAEILNTLRDRVMQLLRQKGEQGEAADGMDIALIIIDKENNTMLYAGANNPIYHISENQLVEHKADRMPIGIHINFTNPFTDKQLTIKEGDSVYLFSDGYADQFGGPKNKKFRYKNFRELLFNIHKKDMKEQHDILANTFNNWKGTEEQVDDIIVFGLKI